MTYSNPIPIKSKCEHKHWQPFSRECSECGIFWTQLLFSPKEPKKPSERIIEKMGNYLADKINKDFYGNK